MAKSRTENINIGELALALRTDDCRKDFFYFVQTFWSVIIKEKPVWGKHIKYICEELQKLSDCIINRTPKPYDLIINIPPGSTKSTIVTIMFPAWLWAIDPTIRIITNSYSAALSTEHSVASRDIIMSDLYKKLFKKVRIRKDSRTKQSYKNSQTGTRQASSTGGTITGKHAHVVINDDPQNPQQSMSAPAREAAVNHTKTLASRKVDMNNVPTIVVMQRLHAEDVTGYTLKKQAGKIRHICLPAEESKNVKPEEAHALYTDGLLDPIRLSREALAEQKEKLGSMIYAGQYGQTPIAEGGNVVKDKWFKYISPELLASINHGEPVVFFGDTAYTEDTQNDPSGFIATMKVNGDLYITNGRKVRYSFPDLCRFIPRYAKSNRYDHRSTIRIEPKASGLSVIQQLNEETDLNVVKTPTPTDSKLTRLTTASPKIEAGRVYLVEGDWNSDFITEVCGFPNQPHDEYVDLICYAIDYHFGVGDDSDDLQELSDYLNQ